MWIKQDLNFEIMAIIIFSILFVFVLAAYAFMSLCVNRTFVQCVEAGPTNAVTAEELKKKSLYIRNKRMVDGSGHTLLPEDYFRVVVNGNCLAPKNIYDKDILVVKKYKQSDKDCLTSGKVALLHLKDTGVYKIREIVSVDGDKIMTKYYLDNGTSQESSKCHNISQLIGIVRFKL